MADCRETSKKKIFTFEERKSKLILQNPKGVDSTKVHVDGCEINDAGIRCDYMHLIPGKEIFIELKGQDIAHAVKQIERAIDLLSSDKKNGQKTSYIICTRSPMTSTEIQNLARNLRSKYNSKLVVRSSPYTDSY